MNCEHAYRSITTTNDVSASLVRMQCRRCGDMFTASARSGIPQRPPTSTVTTTHYAGPTPTPVDPINIDLFNLYCHNLLGKLRTMARKCRRKTKQRSN